MIRLSTVIDSFGAALRTQYGHRLRPEHYRAMAAIKHCRSQASPKMQVHCTQCEHQTLVPHSCGHRHCPHCQHHESQQWLERQLARQVPAEYYMLTFTLPAQFRPLAWAHPRLIYDLMMRCAWQTVRAFTYNDKQLRGTPGAIAVLHTNTRQLEYHPHVHLVMPGAAINTADRRWRTKRAGKAARHYLFSHKALAKVFRAKLLGVITNAGLTLPPHYPSDWVVDCKHVGSGAPALVYLGRYLYRGVVREADILSVDHTHVTFRFRNARTARIEQRTVTGEHFLWLVLQHVLPSRFRRARNFGFLHANGKRLITLLHLVLKTVPVHIASLVKVRAPIPCPCCGAAMRILRTQIRATSESPVRRSTEPICPAGAT